MKKIILNGTDKSIKIVVNGDQKVFIAGVSGGTLSLEFVLEQESSNVEVYGILFGRGNEKYFIRSITTHIAENTRSRILLKSIMCGKSVLNYKGLIKVFPSGRFTDAYLKNDNLVIGDDVDVDSSPQLEIMNNEVKVSHGVTVTTFNEMQKSYLKSRGLSDTLADNLLMRGFVSDVLSKVKNEEDIIFPIIEAIENES